MSVIRVTITVYAALSNCGCFDCVQLKNVTIIGHNLESTCTLVTINCDFRVLHQLASRAIKSHNLDDDSARKKPQAQQSHNETRHVNTVNVIGYFKFKIYGSFDAIG